MPFGKRFDFLPNPVRAIARKRNLEHFLGTILKRKKK
jgi:hypothetical protein